MNVISQTFVRTQCFLEGAIHSSFGKRSFVHRFRSVRSEIVRAYVLSQRESQVEISGVSKKVSRTVLISAGCLVTELAPWPSLVQRFGRCARYDGSGRVVVVDRGQDEKSAPPYAPEELESAWSSLQGLTDVGIKSLETHEESLSPEGRARL